MPFCLACVEKNPARAGYIDLCDAVNAFENVSNEECCAMCIKLRPTASSCGWQSADSYTPTSADPATYKGTCNVCTGTPPALTSTGHPGDLLYYP